MPLSKPNYIEKVGTYEQIHFDFLMNHLWNPNGPSGPDLRGRLINANSEDALRGLLLTGGIEFEETVRLAVFDVESTKIKSFVTDFSKPYYVLVLPPKPRRNNDDAPYTMMQGWVAAHYHTINDSYGM
jgi:hypothetical protein